MRMHRRVLLLMGALSWCATAAAADAQTRPACHDLVASLGAAFEDATHVTVAVLLEQAGREVAYERSRLTRGGDGTLQSEVLERRGLRRPDAAGGGADTGSFTLPCDDYDVDDDGAGGVSLVLRDPDPGAPVPSWTLRFVSSEGRWQPLEMVAAFQVRILFVPVRGRFVTVFDDWDFGSQASPE
jgi:hypothetical protein